MRAAAIIHYPLLMWTNDSTVQYSTVQYSTVQGDTCTVFVLHLISNTYEFHFYANKNLHVSNVYPRKIVLTFLLVIMLTIEAAESD